MIIDLRYLTREVAPNHSQEVLQFRQTVAVPSKNDVMIIGWSNWKDVPRISEEVIDV